MESSNVLSEMFGIFDQKAEDISVKGNGDSSDNRFYKIDPKKATDGIYTAIVKLIPNVFDKENHIVHQTTYRLKDDQGFFNYLSPKTKGKSETCLVYDQYWAWNIKNSKDARLDEISQKIKYNRQSICVIQVIQDLVVPENNGKFFLFGVPVKIQKMIESKLHPSAADIQLGTKPVNVFDPLSSPALKIKATMKSAGEGKDPVRDWDETSWFVQNDAAVLVPVIDPATKKAFANAKGEKLAGEELKKAIVETIVASANLKEYTYADPTPEILGRVKNALALLANEPINPSAQAPATTTAPPTGAVNAPKPEAAPAQSTKGVEVTLAPATDDYLAGIL